jgi:hypothetical protein
MTHTNDDVIRRFVQGKESGKANRMAIEERDGWTFLWGYGHAMYGARSPDGTLYVYYGWYGRSNTTSTHMNKLKGKAKGAYGEPRNDGESVRVVVDGEGGANVEPEPPSGHVLIVVDDGRPGTSYGQLDDAGRPELAEFDGRHLKAPNGYGG